ncbi:Hypothetical predicted protein [Octopus vulgaris]|uniref:Uncharacterized protein n=1 Tax=Octopus vulgaris TaxID=6645 RepID=A0AA36FGI3_OCTVU|nr:Hypothetical predicted protein [Octopus vulgaris]
MAEEQEDMNKRVGRGAKIFSGLSAWFSSSVRPITTGLWVALGGMTHPVEIADFLFSSDVTSPDTAKIFSSSIYQGDSVAIVHASYIHACILAEDIMKIPLGRYILYPKAFQEIFLNPKTSSSCHSLIKHTENNDYCQNKMKSIHEEEGGGDDKNYSDDTEEVEENNQPINMKSQSKNDEETCIKSRQQQPMARSHSQASFQSKSSEKTNDIVSIMELQKASGHLELFIPGKAGCQVMYKS